MPYCHDLHARVAQSYNLFLLIERSIKIQALMTAFNSCTVIDQARVPALF